MHVIFTAKLVIWAHTGTGPIAMPAPLTWSIEWFYFFLNLRLQCSKSGTVEYLIEKELDMRGAESLTGHKDSSQIRRHYFTQHVSDTTSRSGNMLTINEIRDAILTCAQKLI